MSTVSIIVPCFNEEETITQLLEAIYAQTFPRADLEVILADGMSTDATRARIIEFQQTHPDLKISIVDNLRRTIPAALNLAIASAHDEIILRLDAHCVPRPDYVIRSVEALQARKGWNVGGVWEIKPGAKSWIAQSIALAAAHPFGVGDALYRYTSKAAEVDTVPFGAFKRDLIAKIGSFDESLQTNEDYEFNARIRQAGGRVWLDPAIMSTYYARPDLASLARQYARYGYWKLWMLRRYPKTLRPRQAIPPLFVLSLLVLPLLALAGSWAAWAFLVEMVSYAALLLVAAVTQAFEHKQISLIVGIPLAMITMHVAWGAAFLWSLITMPFKTTTQTNG
jgi:glycosyltransferase involved in cell wall biosynthesis